MPRVELIYDMNCPNVQGARKALVAGFVEAGLPPSWTEWDRKSAESPGHVRQYGSPTILVDGEDVAGAEPVDDADSCRVYQHGSGVLRGVPAVERVAAALGNARASAPENLGKDRRGAWRFSAVLPGIGAALVPVGACPACLPVYVGIVSSFGLGFLLDSTTHLLPVTAALFGLALFALALRARTRRGYGPFLLGFASVCVVLVFKFAYVFDKLVYAGLLGLVAASIWNAWPRTRNEVGSCPKCVPQERATEPESAPERRF